MNYWVFFGIFHLLILTYQDIFNKKLVDDRHNYFMSGVTASLFAFYKYNLWIVLGAVLIISILIGIFKKFKLFGDADLKTIMWCFLGFSIIGLPQLIAYITYFTALIILSNIITLILKKKGNIPAYPSFLIAFCLVGWFI